jgi:hypothetical protein
VGWEVLQHPPYIPDLAFNNFSLSGLLNGSVGDQKYGHDEQVWQHVSYFL